MYKHAISSRSYNLFSLQCLPPARARRIKIRPLTQAHRSTALSLAQAIFKDIVRRSRMVNTPVIPNRHVILGLPTETHLQVVILHNQTHKPVEKVAALFV